MTEESKNKTDNTLKPEDSAKKGDKKTDAKNQSVVIENKDELKIDDVKTDKEIIASLMSDDLPDDVKEKLEKKKKDNQKLGKKKGVRKKKKKEKTSVKVGKAFVKATYNNTIITLTDLQGGVISWASAGIAGFKGPKKSTPYAAQIITKIAVMKAKEEYGLSEVSVFVKGVGTGRESAVRALNANGLEITSIKDITPIPHNGCRPRRPRRV